MHFHYRVLGPERPYHNNHLILIFIKILLLVSLLGTIIQAQLESFTPGEAWDDTEGNIINAHAGGILIHEGVYYWIGERRFRQSPTSRGVNVYSSTDLYNWKYEGVALDNSDDQNSEIRLGCVMERPKVIYNDSTGKFVMWFHLELAGQGYTAARSAVAVSDKVTGPYTYMRSMRPHAEIYPMNSATTDTTGQAWRYFRRDFDVGQMARDMTLFKDDDGRAYHIFSSEENQTLHIALLSDDYLSHSGNYVRIFPGGNNEAPAFFKHKGKYFLMASGTTGWDPNPARSHCADSMLGEWTSLGNPCTGNDDEINTTFRSQSTFFFPVPDRENAFIYMGDRWNPGDHINSRYVWLPVIPKDDRFELIWHDEWDLEILGPVSIVSEINSVTDGATIIPAYGSETAYALRNLISNILSPETPVSISILSLNGRGVRKVIFNAIDAITLQGILSLSSGVYLANINAGSISVSYRLLMP